MAKEKEQHVSALQRAVETAMGQGRTLGSEDDPAIEAYPALWLWLSQVYIGMDRLRSPSTITVNLGPQGVLASVSDRDLCVACGATCKHLDDVFKALEAALTSEVPPIRSWGKKEPRLRKRNREG